MVAYLDSSLVLRYILAGDLSIRHAAAFPRMISSELLEIECRRVLHRCRMAGDLTDETLLAALHRLEEVLAGTDLLELSSPIKTRAMESFPSSIKTLDTLHLSTAMIFLKFEPEEHLSLFSCDRGMNLCARSLGLTAPLL